MADTEKANEPNTQRTRDAERREAQRREDDTAAGAKHPDTAENDNPPQPFSGPHH